MLVTKQEIALRCCYYRLMLIVSIPAANPAADDPHIDLHPWRLHPMYEANPVCDEQQS
jgi:hypothetical protein